MVLIADGRLLRFVLPAMAAALIAPLPQAASAEESPPESVWRDAGAGGGVPTRIRDMIGDRADKDLHAFYAARDDAPLWLDDFNQPSDAATMLLLRLRTADRDGLDPARFDPDKLARLLDRARHGDAGDAVRAELALSSALAQYVKAMRQADHTAMAYESPLLAPQAPTTRKVLEEAAAARSLDAYVDDFGWMNPFYAPLRKALDDPQYSLSQKQVIAANLERVRAIPGISTGKHILVDAASARLWMYEGDDVVGTMKVVVGNPKLGETPMMAGWIRWAIENPYWEVPNDITQKEIAPDILKSGVRYLKQHGYEVLDGWDADSQVIDPATVDWKAVHAGDVQVHVRQKPGAENFMGKVKFEFPNPDGIYLHDTPAKWLMSKDARQLSHGCIRMQDAALMHEWLMGAPFPENAPPEDRVPLEKPVPIYVTYLTALPADGGEIVFHDDPYGRDAGIRLATAD